MRPGAVATPAPAPQQPLHGSVHDPVLGSIGFLNEVMGRYPDAISFAPGAPHPGLLDDVDPAQYTDRYLQHLVHDKGLAPDRARRLLYEYGPSRGLINGLVADALRRDQGIDAPQEAVVITVGAQEALLLSLRALCRGPEDVLAVVSPCFVGVTGAARLLDIAVAGVEETADGLDLDALARLCAEVRRGGRRIRVCYVAPDFSNPGGGRMPLADRERLLELAEIEDFLVLEDNAYGFTASPSDELPALKALDRGRRVVHVGTFAKVCFPGARVGYVVADQPVTTGSGTGLLADALALLKGMVTVNTSPLAQAVIGGMLLAHDGSLAEVGRRKGALYRDNLRRLGDGLRRHLLPDRPPGVSWNRPDGGFFVRMRLPVRVDDALLERSAQEYGVLWTPMAPFHVGTAGDHELRLSCSYLEPDQIDAGVRRLAAFVQEEARL
ncbi:PLP-dependent aminotransferase family protein [Streptomyces sp. ME08-AFT2]|uniref:aminotransferase-like domain-containing protein n=1 Tax=Streptomyces sp. ME08-AFT2 TaxID=3028683 RepID=UPI0029A19CCA|nr:PLP-dependent aminotransferase family protein [Streptomyces sp. ME08-AFT2]MDX3312436.1 PLP-dependent aminotransferase family protein [Streptomyces sp. ME08-AFT2]